MKGPWPEAVLTAVREAGIGDEDRERVDTDPQLLAGVAALVIDAAKRLAAALSTMLKLVVNNDELTPEKVLQAVGVNPADYEYEGDSATGTHEVEEMFMAGVPGGNRDAQVAYFRGLGLKVNPSSVALARRREQPKADGLGPVAYLGDSWVSRRDQWRGVAYLSGVDYGRWCVTLADADPVGTFGARWRFSVRKLQ